MNVEPALTSAQIQAAYDTNPNTYSAPASLSYTLLSYNNVATITLNGVFTNSGSRMGMSVADVACSAQSANTNQVVFSCPITNDRSITLASIKVSGNYPTGISYFYEAATLTSPAVILSNHSVTNFTRGANATGSFTLTGTGLYTGLVVSLNGTQCQSQGTVNVAGTSIANIDCSNVIAPTTGANVSVAVSGTSLPASGNTLSINIPLIDPPTATFAGWMNGTALTCTFGSSCQNTQAANNCGAGATVSYSIASADQVYATVDASTGAITPVAVTSAPITVTASQASVTGVCTGASSSYQLSVTTGTAGVVSFATASPTALTWNGAAQTATNVASATCSNGGSYTPAITYSSSDSTNAPVDSSGVVTVNQAGSYTITANAAANGNCVAASTSYTLVMNKATPSLSFADASKTINYGDTGTALSSPSVSGTPSDATGAISYSCAYTNTASGTDGCAVSGSGTLTITKPGSGTVTVSMAGDANYNAATADYSLTVNKATPTIVFANNTTATTKNSIDADFTIAASASGPTGASINPSSTFSYSSANTSSATVDSTSGLVSIVGQGVSGDVVITASLLADDYYEAASSAYTITISNIACPAPTDSTFDPNTATTLIKSVDDNFDSNTIDTAKWKEFDTTGTGPSSGGTTVTGGNLNIAANGGTFFKNALETVQTFIPSQGDITVEFDMTPSACSGNNGGAYSTVTSGSTTNWNYLHFYNNFLAISGTYSSTNECVSGHTYRIKWIIRQNGDSEGFVYDKASGTNYPTSPTVIKTETIPISSFNTPRRIAFLNQNSTTIFDNISITQSKDSSIPTNFLGEAQDQSVFLQWNGYGDHYVEYKPSYCEDWKTHGSTSGNGITINGLENGYTYDFRVRTPRYTETPTNLMLTPSATHTTNEFNYLHHTLSTGQSLSVGVEAGATSTDRKNLTTTQPFNNRALSGLSLIPLVEPVAGNPALYVETISSSLANSLTHFVGSSAGDYQSVVTSNGLPGAAYTRVKKNGTNTNYNDSIIRATRATTASLSSNNKMMMVDAVTVIHGEEDEKTKSAATYKGYLEEWQRDYEADLKNVTGQTRSIPLFTDQMSSWSFYYHLSPQSAIGQWEAARDNPTKIYLVTPKYIFDYSDGLHLKNYSYRRLGEYYGKVMKQVLVDKQPWLPLSPKEITITGNVILAKFNVPVQPLEFDTTAVDAVTDGKYGFEYYDSSTTTLAQSAAKIGAIQLVDTDGNSLADAVEITLNSPPSGTPYLAYAYTAKGTSYTDGGCDAGSGTLANRYWAGAHRNLSLQCDTIRGNLRDSDTTPAYYQDSNVPAAMGNLLRNWLITFKEPITTP